MKSYLVDEELKDHFIYIYLKNEIIDFEYYTKQYLRMLKLVS